MRRRIAISLAILLALGSFAPAYAQEASQANSVPNVAMAPTLSCVQANKNFKASIALSPFNEKATCRLYFKSALGADWYYVNLAATAAGFEATLPAPLPEAGPISYYAECIVATAPGQTAQLGAPVVAEDATCDDKAPAALAGASGSVAVFSVAGGAALPAGFVAASVASVTAGAAITAGAAAAVATGAGISTAAIVATAAGVVAVGTTTAVVVSGGTDTPASPSR